MNPNDIAWHLENLGDTWKGWGKVLQSLAELLSQEWRNYLRALVDLFTAREDGSVPTADDKTGLLRPEYKEQLSEVLKQPTAPNTEGKYEFDGLSSVKGSSKKQ